MALSLTVKNQQLKGGIRHQAFGIRQKRTITTPAADLCFFGRCRMPIAESRMPLLPFILCRSILNPHSAIRNKTPLD
jgi:hypothetical protein